MDSQQGQWNRPSVTSGGTSTVFVGSSARPQTNIPPQSSAIAHQTERVGEAVKMARDLGNRAGAIADIYFGGVDGPAGVGPNQPPAANALSRLDIEVTDLHTALAYLSTQIDRLSCI